jgi:hypothetical protein
VPLPWARICRQNAGGNQVLDAVGGLLFYPAVDLLPVGLEVCFELDLEDAAGIVRFMNRIDILALEGVGFFTPQGISYSEKTIGRNSSAMISNSISILTSTFIDRLKEKLTKFSAGRQANQKMGGYGGV